jgi:hypothetical protein
MLREVLGKEVTKLQRLLRFQKRKRFPKEKRTACWRRKLATLFDSYGCLFRFRPASSVVAFDNVEVVVDPSSSVLIMLTTVEPSWTWQ